MRGPYSVIHQIPGLLRLGNKRDRADSIGKSQGIWQPGRGELELRIMSKAFRD